MRLCVRRKFTLPHRRWQTFCAAWIERINRSFAAILISDGRLDDAILKRASDAGGESRGETILRWAVERGNDGGGKLRSPSWRRGASVFGGIICFVGSSELGSAMTQMEGASGLFWSR